MRKVLTIMGVLMFVIFVSNVGISCGGGKGKQLDSISAYRMSQLDKARAYCKAHGMNPDTILLYDFKIHSGNYRFFVYVGDSIALQGLCAHGCGSGSAEGNPVFSNEPGSNASSLGFYKVGRFYTTRNYTYRVSCCMVSAIPTATLIEG